MKRFLCEITKNAHHQREEIPRVTLFVRSTRKSAIRIPPNAFETKLEKLVNLVTPRTLKLRVPRLAFAFALHPKSLPSEKVKKKPAPVRPRRGRCVGGMTSGFVVGTRLPDFLA